MLLRDNLMKKLDKSNKRVIVTVVLLPSKVPEVIVNYEGLEEKAEYIKNAYDENLRLKTNQDIVLIDIIVICEEDIKKLDIQRNL